MDKKNQRVDENEAQDMGKDDIVPEMMDSAEEVLPEGASETPSEDELSAKLAAAEEQAKAHYDRLLRLSAEFENYKKRTAREVQDMVKYANEKLARELLVVVDNLERAIASAAERYPQDDPLLQGVHLTLDETLKILARHHVTPITSLGAPFDPTFHQAMMQTDIADHPPNTVVDELQKGYLIHERLLRPALVTVSKIPADNGPNND